MNPSASRSPWPADEGRLCRQRSTGRDPLKGAIFGGAGGAFFGGGGVPADFSEDAVADLLGLSTPADIAAVEASLGGGFATAGATGAFDMGVGVEEVARGFGVGDSIPQRNALGTIGTKHDRRGPGSHGACRRTGRSADIRHATRRADPDGRGGRRRALQRSSASSSTAIASRPWRRPVLKSSTTSRAGTTPAGGTRRSTICRPWRMKSGSCPGCDPKAVHPLRNRGNSTPRLRRGVPSVWGCGGHVGTPTKSRCRRGAPAAAAPRRSGERTWETPARRPAARASTSRDWRSPRARGRPGARGAHR